MDCLDNKETYFRGASDALAAIKIRLENLSYNTQSSVLGYAEAVYREIIRTFQDFNIKEH